MKMHMDDSEILISYRNAKNQSEQITVLADLNACTRTEMAQWLTDHGEHVDGRALRYSKKKAEDSEPEAVEQETPAVEDWHPNMVTEKFIDECEPEELKAKEGELPNYVVILTEYEAVSLAEFVERNLLDVIRRDTDFDSIQDLKNILSAYGKMCHARADM